MKIHPVKNPINPFGGSAVRQVFNKERVKFSVALANRVGQRVGLGNAPKSE